MPATKAPKTLKPRNKAGQKHGLPSMAGKEPLRSCETLRGYKDLSPPAQNERTPPFTAYPIADLISEHGPEDAENDGVP
jgi:hypothetical protein